MGPQGETNEEQQTVPEADDQDDTTDGQDDIRKDDDLVFEMD